MNKKLLSPKEYGKQGGTARWEKIKDPKQRSRIMKKVSAARKLKINQ